MAFMENLFLFRNWIWSTSQYPCFLCSRWTPWSWRQFSQCWSTNTIFNNWSPTWY